jgi:hypothetical protein
MKNVVIVIVLIAAVTLGGLGFYQQKQLARNQEQLAALREQLRAAEEALAEQAAATEKAILAEQKARVLQDTLAQTTQMSASQSKQVSELEQSLAASKTNSTGLARLFNDPEMKEMIRAQQQAFMGPMIEKNYAELFSQLNLTAEQKEHIKGLIENKMLVAADMGMSMLDGSADAAKRKELGEQIKKETDAMDLALKEYLGEENYKTFQEYEKSMPDRMNMAQFKDQLAGTGTSLESGQEKKLIDLMSRERSNFKWTTDYNNQNPGEGDLATMFTEDRLTRHSQEQTEYNRQLLEQARTFLRQDQLTALEKFLENQRKMQEAAMKMAGKMFGDQN